MTKLTSDIVNKKKISVVIATYNGEHYILEQLESIAHQTVKPDEIIVCDDCSSDRTLELLNGFSKKSDIHCYVEQNVYNLGVTKTFEKGASKATGDIVFFCDQDDYWLDTKIEKAILAFEKYQPSLIFSDAKIVNEDLSETGNNLWKSVGFTPKDSDVYVLYEKNELLLELLQHNVLTGMTIACAKDLLNKCIPFPNFLLHDYWLAFNSSIVGRIVAINEPLVLYRQHSNNVIGVGNNNKKRSRLALKERHLKIIETQIDIYKAVSELCKDNDVDADHTDMVEAFYKFSLLRKEAVNKSLFSIFKIRKYYKKYSYKDFRFFKKDIFYRLFLKSVTK